MTEVSQLKSLTTIVEVVIVLKNFSTYWFSYLFLFRWLLYYHMVFIVFGVNQTNVLCFGALELGSNQMKIKWIIKKGVFQKCFFVSFSVNASFCAELCLWRTWLIC